MKNSFKNVVLTIIAYLLLVIIYGFIIMWLWNSCVVAIAPKTLAPITVYQAVGLKILFNLLIENNTTDWAVQKNQQTQRKFNN